MRLVACETCHAQFDVTAISQAEFRCPCGATVENVAHAAVDASVLRCGACGATITPGAVDCDYCGSAIVRDTEKLSLICPECYARNPENSRYCTSCAVPFRPQAVSDDGPELGHLLCPVCETVMGVRGIGGIQACECGTCHGLWVPGGSFDELIGRAVGVWREDPSGGFGPSSPAEHNRRAPSLKIEYRRCPVCDGVMPRKNFGRRSGIIIDWCGKHGTWLDADELGGIAQFILSGGLQADRRPSVESELIMEGIRPTTVEQVEIMLDADRIMTSARSERERRANRSLRQHTFCRGDSIADFLEALLGCR